MASSNDSGLRLRRGSASSTHSTASIASAVLSTAEQIESKVSRTILLLWDELPHWRRDNGFIQTGYRPDSNSYTKSFASILSVHNETVNIWTHMLGAVASLGGAAFVYAVIAPRYESATESDVLVFACFFAGAVMCLSMSAVYHTLCNHSEEVAKWGNKLDYSGIVFLIVGSYVPALYYGFFCEPALMTVYLYTIALLGLGCGLVSWLEHFRQPKYRPYRTAMFVALGLSGVVPVVHGLMMYGRQALEDKMSLSWVVAHGAMYIFGAFLYAFRWPERSFPKTFDIWGSSHQIFHVFVLLAAGTHFYGMAKAFDSHHTRQGSLCV